MVDTLRQPAIGPEGRVVAALGSVLALAAWSGPDGPMLASGGVDGTVRRWNATTGAPVGDPMTGHTESVRALTAWSGPDGPMLASASDDGTIRRWNATTGAPVGDPMTGHTGSVLALTAWSGPDGPMLASGGDDRTVRRWNATTGAPVGDPMTGHTGVGAGADCLERPRRAHAGLRQRRRDDPALERHHRRPGRRPHDRPHRIGEGADGLELAPMGPCWPPPATMGRSGAGTRPPAPRSATP